MKPLEQIDWIKEEEEKEELADWLEEDKDINHLPLSMWDWTRAFFKQKKKEHTEKRTFSRLLKKYGSK